MTITWERHHAGPGWRGFDVRRFLVAEVVFYDTSADGPCWMGSVRNTMLEGRPRFATAEEAMAAVEAAVVVDPAGPVCVWSS